MTGERGVTGSKRSYDAETTAMVYEGVGFTQLERLFGMDERTIKAKIGTLPPAGRRMGGPYWRLRDIAPYLIEPKFSLEEFIAQMTVAQLPMLVRKEFWAGMRSRQLYEIAAGELWETEKVQGAISEVFKTIKMQALLFRDNVERETELSPRQRDIIKRLTNTLLEDLHDSIQRNFDGSQESEPGGTPPA